MEAGAVPPEYIESPLCREAHDLRHKHTAALQVAEWSALHPRVPSQACDWIGVMWEAEVCPRSGMSARAGEGVAQSAS